MSATYFMVDAGQLLALERVQKILHAERRLDGDAMRDLGSAIESVVRTCRELPVPDDGDRRPTSSIRKTALASCNSSS